MKSRHLPALLIALATCAPPAFLASATSAGAQTATPSASPGADAFLSARTLSRLYLLDVARVGEQRLVAVGERGHILRSEDAGKNWTRIATPTQATLTALFFVDDKLGWAVGHDHVILHTTDGGNSWQQQFSDLKQEAPLLDVFFQDARHGYAVGAYGSFLETRDGGATWERRSISESDKHFNAMTAGDGQLFIAGEGGLLLTSTDDGATWTELPSPYKGSFFGMLYLADRSLLVFGMRGNIFRSSDVGRTWQQVANEGGAFLMGGSAQADGTVVLAGLTGNLLLSKDTGRSFARQKTPSNKGNAAALALPDGSLLVVGDGGASIVKPQEKTDQVRSH